MGGVWHQAGCCCPTGDTCVCWADQPSAVVSLSPGTDCTDAEGTYTFLTRYEAECAVIWQRVSGGETWALQLRYCKAQAAWCALLRRTNPTTAPNKQFGADLDDCPCASLIYARYSTDVTAHLSCVANVITGSFDLAGDAGSPCEDETATVTLG